MLADMLLVASLVNAGPHTVFAEYAEDEITVVDDELIEVDGVAGVYSSTSMSLNDDECTVVLSQKGGRVAARYLARQHEAGPDAGPDVWVAASAVRLDLPGVELALPTAVNGSNKMTGRFVVIALRREPGTPSAAASNVVAGFHGLLVDVDREHRVFFRRDRDLSHLQVTASSSLVEGKVTHGPELVADADERTAWAEGKPGPGIGEWLEIRFAAPRPVTALHLRNGYQKSDGTFRNNGRVARLELTYDGRPGEVLAVKDSPGEERYDVHPPGKVTVIRLTIRAVVPGAKFEDTCVTEAYFDAEP